MNKGERGEIIMNIATKYEIGDIVYAIHSCWFISNGQLLSAGRMSGTGLYRADPDHPCTEMIYFVSPHVVKNIIVTCREENTAVTQYRLSDGIMSEERDLFGFFEEAAECAVTLYEKQARKIVQNNDSPGRYKDAALKEVVCGRLQHVLKAVLTCEQLERFKEEFLKATQVLVFNRE